MDKRSKRIRTIVALLKQRNGATVRELAQALGVSEMTIRRDLNTLSYRNIVKLVHGAAIFNPAHDPDAKEDIAYHLSAEEDHMRREKTRIGRMAASLVRPGDVIIIDTGTTTEHLARRLPDMQDLTVICYNMNILLHVYRKSGCRLIVAGGVFQENTQMFQSEEGEALIRRIRATKAFISAAGINDTLEVTCANQYEVEAKKAVIGSSQEKILVADSSKFGRVKQAYFGELAVFDTVITDQKLPRFFVEQIHDMRITLHRV